MARGDFPHCDSLLNNEQDKEGDTPGPPHQYEIRSTRQEGKPLLSVQNVINKMGWVSPLCLWEMKSMTRREHLFLICLKWHWGGGTPSSPLPLSVIVVRKHQKNKKVVGTPCSLTSSSPLMSYLANDTSTLVVSDRVVGSGWKHCLLIKMRVGWAQKLIHPCFKWQGGWQWVQTPSFHATRVVSHVGQQEGWKPLFCHILCCLIVSKREEWWKITSVSCTLTLFCLLSLVWHMLWS